MPPPLRGLGALAQLDLDHFHLLLRGVLLELVGAEGARALVVDRLPAAEVARPHVPDDVAARQVEARDAALARVVVEAAPRGPSIQRSIAFADRAPNDIAEMLSSDAE